MTAKEARQIADNEREKMVKNWTQDRLIPKIGNFCPGHSLKS